MGTSPREGGLGPSQADALSAEKIEAIGIEYSYLLTSQLDSQRAYYEEQTAALTAQFNDLRNVVEELKREREVERNLRREEEEKQRSQAAKQIADLEKAKAKAEQRANKLAAELKEEKAMTDGLMKNIKSMKERLEEEEKGKDECLNKIQELQDQVRDLMFFLDANARIEQGGGEEAEAAGGSIEVIPPPSNHESKKKKGKKRQ